MIVPAGLSYQNQLADNIMKIEFCQLSSSSVRELLEEVSTCLDALISSINSLEEYMEADGLTKLKAMDEMRQAADMLEGLVPDDIWPLPSYAEMLFRL